jgi:hypothetical protein
MPFGEHPNMPLQVLEGPIIEAGQSLSSAVDCSRGQLVRITMPAAWTRAPLTFQISSDGGGFNDLVGLDGYEIQFTNVVPGSAVVVPSDTGRAVGWLKVRSGTSDNPVPQAEGRLFAVAVIYGNFTADAAEPEGRRS